MGPTGETALPGVRTVSAVVGPGPIPGMWTVRFTSQAVPGTLAAFAGTLAAARLDIVSALVRLSEHGTVTDLFDVTPLDGGTFGPHEGERLAAFATEVLNGRHDLDPVLAELRRRFPQHAGVAPRVETRTDSEITTGVNVVCADRPGLLYDITSTLTRHGLRTRSLSVLTFNGRGHDTFRVVDAEGVPPRDERVLAALREELRSVCGG